MVASSSSNFGVKSIQSTKIYLRKSVNVFFDSNDTIHYTLVVYEQPGGNLI